MSEQPSTTAAFVVDVGSTFTKASLVALPTGELLGRAETTTTHGVGTGRPEVMDGVRRLAERLGLSPTPGRDAEWLLCSSAGGGLRLAVVGYERQVTAEAGHRVGLSAGARVVHVSAGPLDATGLGALRDARPDLVLLVGGTDGGNAEILRHNATRLATSRLPRGIPVVVAGNVDARDEVAATLTAAGRTHVLADNVLPEIGVVAPMSARAAIREAFLRHVIGGKGLSRDPALPRLVRAATPDAVLRGVEVLADALGHDVLVVDVGGATTDVYSAVVPTGEDAGLRRDVVAHLTHERTVEADLGMRWSAAGVLEAAARERLETSSALPRYAARLTTAPDHLPTTTEEQQLDLELARLAATIAVRRHGRPAAPGEQPRPLTDVGLVLGSGGALRHNDTDEVATLLHAVADDTGGGWRTPRHARVAVDAAYQLVVAGLLADSHPGAATAAARRAAQ